MRVCSTYRSSTDYDGRKGCREYRLDAFDELPEWDEETVITLCGKDVSSVPEGFTGLVDVGDDDIPCGFRKIVSHHDFDGTPSADEIVSILSANGAEVTKGAFMVRSFGDLCSLLDASASIGRRHVILGMGEAGTVTRLRQRILGNEFTFGYVGEPTAPGQLGADEMSDLGDDCTILGITGNPLGHSMSPLMQGAAMKAAGIKGVYLRFQSDSLDRIEDAIRGYDIRGMNVTIPYKTDILAHLDRVDDVAGSVGAVNTIVNDNGTLKGYNTDVAGIVHAFGDGCPDKGSKALIMGSGGAARAAVAAMTGMGCEVTVVGRNPVTVNTISEDFSVSGVLSADVSDYDIVMNCTPIGMKEDTPYPADISGICDRHIVFDAVYNRTTELMSKARSAGATILSGRDMLIGQGAEAFRLWFGMDADIDAMEAVFR